MNVVYSRSMDDLDIFSLNTSFLLEPIHVAYVQIL
jgi:hypothetical protein